MAASFAGSYVAAADASQALDNAPVLPPRSRASALRSQGLARAGCPARAQLTPAHAALTGSSGSRACAFCASCAART
jgi:hypothetical protein